MFLAISTTPNNLPRTITPATVTFQAAEKPDPVDEALGEAGAALKSVSFLPDAVAASGRALTDCFNFVSENFRSVALSVDAIRVGAGVFQDGGHISTHTARAAAGCVSGWMGACAGEIAGTHIGELVGGGIGTIIGGPLGAAAGGTIGGVVGNVAGGLGGGLFGTKLGETTVNTIIA
jgi:hypothetical protein